MADDAPLKEYYELLAIVREFDRNLLTVKGWAATVAIAALTLAFQNRHYGIFLVAGLSGLAFWALDAAMKRHQMRHYVRMREIEVQRSTATQVSAPGAQPPAATTPRIDAPLIDWAWEIAPRYLSGAAAGPPPPPERYRGSAARAWLYWLLPHVALPHAVAVLAGLTLFLLGQQGLLGDMPL